MQESIAAFETQRKGKTMSTKKIRNPIAVAMTERYGKTQTTMRDRRLRRPKDKRQRDRDFGAES